MSIRPIADVAIMARPKHKYYGAYPAGSLQRIRDLLGVSIFDPVLHVCSGKVKEYPYRGFGPNDKTVDMDESLNPDFTMDVREQLPWCGGRAWCGVIADPPYSEADAARYAGGAASYPAPAALVRRCLQHVRPGGRIAVLHYQWVRHPKQIDGVPIRSVAVMPILMGQGNAGRICAVFERMDDRRVG